VNDHDPKPLLYQFQSENDGEFEWWPLERGPEVWRIEIARRDSGNPRTITEFLQADHRRLDAIYADFRGDVDSGNMEEAAKKFREFDLGLRRHIQVEEDILFPVFEEKTGMTDAGPTFVMRMEHQEIKETMERILGNADSGDQAKAREGAEMLLQVLSEHNMKEEHILYPESDAFLMNAEREEVIKKAQTY